MKMTIEDQIIAYFDGRLDDHDSAELLHRASVSPEIRELFQEHQLLREHAQRSIASAAIPASLESSLFERIAMMQEEEVLPEERRGAVLWWRKLAPALALLLLLAGSAAIYTSYRSTTAPNTAASNAGGSNAAAAGVTSSPFASNQSTQQGTSSTPRNEAPTNAAGSIKNTVASEAANSAAPNEAAVTASSNTTTSKVIANIAAANRNAAVKKYPAARDMAFTNGPSSSTPDKLSQNDRSTAQDNADNMTSSTQPIAEILIAPVPARLQDVAASAHHGIDPATLISRKLTALTEEPRNRYEVGVDVSSGFSYPASGPTVQPFADQRISLSYNLLGDFRIGLRMINGRFESLPAESRSVSQGVTVVTRSLEMTRAFAGELFVQQRFPALFRNGLELDLAAGAGLKSQGYLLDAELGFHWPFTSHLFGGLSFALSRVHSTSPAMQDLINSESSLGPVIFQGSDVRNTLNGRLNYGLTYRF